jgi:hypothetical protein
VELVFSIRLHIKDLAILRSIQASFYQVGKIYVHDKAGEATFRVSSVKELEVIINHFRRYPLITQKWSDFMLFKQAFDLVVRKEHLTLDGLQEIVNIKASLNSEISHQGFPNTVPVTRPSPPEKFSIDPF